MQDIINKQKEEFDKKYSEVQLAHEAYLGEPDKDGDRRMYPISVENKANEIWNWHTSSQHQLLQALIEREERQLADERQIRVVDGYIMETYEEKSIFNIAKQDTINNLKTLQDNLK